MRDLRIRLLGVALSRLDFCEAQLRLFDRSAPRSRAIDEVRAKYGYDSVHLAITVVKRSRSGAPTRRIWPSAE